MNHRRRVLFPAAPGRYSDFACRPYDRGSTALLSIRRGNRGDGRGLSGDVAVGDQSLSSDLLIIAVDESASNKKTTGMRSEKNLGGSPEADGTRRDRG